MKIWAEVRTAWIKKVNAKALLTVIGQVAADYKLDENWEQDAVQRIECVLWLSTRGKQGKEWGYASAHVMKFLETRGKKDE